MTEDYIIPKNKNALKSFEDLSHYLEHVSSNLKRAVDASAFISIIKRREVESTVRAYQHVSKLVKDISALQSESAKAGIYPCTVSENKSVFIKNGN